MFLFQSTELEELGDRARLVLPQRSSIKAAVRKHDPKQISRFLCILLSQSCVSIVTAVRWVATFLQKGCKSLFVWVTIVSADYHVDVIVFEKQGVKPRL